MDIGYKREYRIRYAVPGSNKKTIEVTLPYVVIAREAEKRGLTVDEFLAKFIAVAEYNNFDGIHYTFKEVGRGDEKDSC